MNIFITCISFLKELCLFFATIGLAYPLDGISQTLRLTCIFLLCGLCGALFEKKSFRYFVPAVLVFIVVPEGVTLRISLLFPVILCVLRCFKGRWEYTYDFTKEEMKWGFGAYAFFSVFALIESGSYFLNASLPWFISFFCLSVFLLRILRTESEETLKPSYILLNAAAVFMLGLLICAFLLPEFQTAFSAFLSLIDRFILSPLRDLVIRIIGLLFYLPAKLLVWLFSRMHVNDVNEADLPEFGDLTIYENDYSHGSFGQYVRITAEAVIALLLIFAAFLIVRKMRKTRKYAYSQDIVRTSVRPLRPLRSTVQLSGVRAVYKKYMKLMERHQIRAQGYASDETAVKCEELTGICDAYRLRALWLPVRYGGMKDESAAEAQQLYRNIRDALRRTDRHV